MSDRVLSVVLLACIVLTVVAVIACDMIPRTLPLCAL